MEQVEETAEIVAAYVSNNAVRASDVPDLIKQVHVSLSQLTHNGPEPKNDVLVPPVSIKQSIQRDYLISLEDGKRYKTLRRHLSTRGLTFDEYKAKWRLPPDYPTVAPAYSKRRSELARVAGLGNSRARKPTSEAPVVESPKAKPALKRELKVTPYTKGEQTRRSGTKAAAEA